MGLAEVAGKQNNGPEISFMNPPQQQQQQQTGRSRKNSRVTRSQINDFQPHALNFGPHPEDEQLVVDSSPKQQQQQQRNRYHVCRHCNRSFSSGRALGGHIRIHGTSFSGGKAAEIAPNNGDDAAAVAVTAVDSSNNSSCRLLLLDGKPDQDDQDYDNGRSMDDAHANATATGDADADADADAETSSAQANKELGNGHGDDDDGVGDETNNKNKARMKMVSLYTLRNNPRRSCKFLDPEFRLDHGVVASNNSNKRSSHESNQNPSSATGNIHGNSNLGCSESGSEQRRPAHGPVVGKWSVTRNRSGRKLKRKGSTRAAADDRDTANLLVMLAAKVQGNGNVNGGMESTEESVMKLFPSIESQGSIKGLSDDCDDEDDDDKEGQQDFKASKKPRSSSNINNNGSCDYQGECGNDGIGDYGDAAAVVAGRGGMGMQEMNMVDKNRGSRSHSHRCNTCNKVFTSHQALGGHRASHRKVKGCFAQEEEAEETEDEEEEEEEEDDEEEEEEEEEEEDEEEENGYDDADAEADREDDAAAECQASSHANAYISKNRSKAKANAKRACEDEADIALSHLTSEAAATAAAPEQEPLSKKPHTSSSNSNNNNNNNVAVAAAPPHQCSICLRVFSSGQALGGHKRCHWVADKGNHVNLTDSSVISSVVGGDRRSSRDRASVSASASASASAAAADELIDLNQPPPMDEEYELPRFDHGSGRSANHRVKVLQSSSRRLD